MAHYSVWKHEYDDEWIRKNYGGKCTKAFHQRYVTETGHEVCMETFRAHIRRDLGLKPYGYYYTDEEIEFVRNNYGKSGAQACAEKLGCSLQRVYGIAQSSGIKMSKEDFRKHVNVFEAKYPVGTIKPVPGLDDSEYEIKTEDGWKSLGRYAWEKEYGEVPDGYYIVFLDRNPSNARIENLMAVPKGVVGGMNYAGLWHDDPQFNKAILLIQTLQWHIRNNSV